MKFSGVHYSPTKATMGSGWSNGCAGGGIEFSIQAIGKV